MCYFQDHSQSGLIVCGGDDFYARDDCVAMDGETGQWSTLGRTVGHRTDHSSWLAPDGLMFIGGDYDDEISTEIISLEDGKSRPHYQLQYSGRGACLIPDDSTGTYILTSGTDVSRYDSDGWVESLPRMMQFRNWHGCGSYQAESGELILLVAGGWDMTDLSFLSSVETLTLGASAWNFGPALPRELSNLVGATVDNKIFMLGGFNREQQATAGRPATAIQPYADVLQWQPDSLAWTKVGEMLEPTDSHAVSTIELNEKLLEICL